MADKRISQLIERTDIANNDVLPIVASGATTTNKVTISTIQNWMQDNLDVGVTSVGITLGTSGTDVNVTGSPITTSGNITINIPTASATNRGLLSAADWSTFNAKQPAGNYVTLDTTQTITAHKTFTASGGQPSITINHSSGAGHALDITKAGNGEGIRVNKTSGSGNAVSVVGTLEATTIVRTGGTSSQFLKADGSVDSNTYVTTDTSQAITATKQFTQGLSLGSAGGTNQLTVVKNIGTIHEGSAGSNILGFNNSNNIYFGKGLNNGGVISWNNAAVRYYTLPDADGTIALTSDLGNYVTLGTTQTITGSKTISNATTTFINMNSTNANGASLNFQRNGVNIGHIGNSGVLGVGVLDDLEVRAGSTRSLHLKTDGGQLTLASGGAATFSSSVNANATSTFSNAVGVSAIFSNGGSVNNFNSIELRGGTAGTAVNWQISKDNSASNSFELAASTTNGGTTYGSPVFRISSTGAATFSSSVTGTSFSLGTGNGRLSTSGFWGTQITAGTGSFANFALLDAATNGIMYNPAGTLNMVFTGNVQSVGLRSIDAANTWSFSTGSNASTPNIVALGTISGTPSIQGFNFGFSANQNLCLQPQSGNVGIGTTSPTAKLHVAGDILIPADGRLYGNSATVTGSRSYIEPYNASTGDMNLVTGFSTASIVFGTQQGTERMRITSGGNVGIGTGTTNPTKRLQVEASVAGEVALISNKRNSSNGDYAIVSELGSNCNNTNNYHYIALTGGADRMYIYGNGNLANTNNSYGSISDAKLKENIEDATPKLDDLMKVKVRNYNLIGDDKKQIGVIAQELEEVFPAMIDESEDFEDVEVPQVDEEGNEILNEEGEVVTTKERVSKGTTTKSVKYSVFVPMLIKAMQEQQEQIKSLTEQVEALKSQING